jgi:hypothetical protein
LLQHDGRARSTTTTNCPSSFSVGRADGSRDGRVLDYSGKPERQLCRLFMSMMDKMDVRPTALAMRNDVGRGVTKSRFLFSTQLRHARNYRRQTSEIL